MAHIHIFISAPPTCIPLASTQRNVHATGVCVHRRVCESVWPHTSSRHDGISRGCRRLSCSVTYARRRGPSETYSTTWLRNFQPMACENHRPCPSTLRPRILHLGDEICESLASHRILSSDSQASGRWRRYLETSNYLQSVYGHQRRPNTRNFVEVSI